MDAKLELKARLYSVFPNEEAKIDDILQGFPLQESQGKSEVISKSVFPLF